MAINLNHPSYELLPSPPKRFWRRRLTKEDQPSNLLLCAWRRQELQAVSLPKLNHAGNVLLLLRTQRADFLKESFKAGRRHDAHEATGRLAEVAVSVRYAARRENGRAFLGDKRFVANRPLVFPFEDLERLVFAMMDVWRRSAPRNIVRLNRADDATGVATVDANNHRNAEDLYLLTSVGWNLDGLHNIGGDVVPSCAGWQGGIQRLFSMVTAPNPDEGIGQGLLENAMVAVARAEAEDETVVVTFGL